MDNRNMYNAQQNNFYPYGGYPAAAAPIMRPEVPAYMMPQATSAAFLKGRPVSSYEEARVAQIDLDGSISIFPDLGNKRIYTKRINADGTASLLTYALSDLPEETPQLPQEYVTKTEFNELKSTLDSILEKITPKPNKATVNQPLNF